MAAQTQSARDANDPFGPLSNLETPPDVILRSDAEPRHVHIPVQWAGPHEGREADCPGIRRKRDSLILCYPRFSGTGFNNLDGVVKAYNAVDKFLIPDGQTLLEQIMVSPKFLEKEPHRVFAIACVLHLEEPAKRAAMETLKLPRFVSALSIPEFDLITARHLRQLEVFHATCSESAMARAERYAHMQPVGQQEGHFVWWTSQNHAPGCGYTYDDTVGEYVFPARWFSDHIAAAKNAANNIPAAESVLKAVNEVSYANLETLLKCPECRRDAKGSLSMMEREMEYDLRMDYRRVRGRLAIGIRFLTILSVNRYWLGLHFHNNENFANFDF
ncbi:hypothetical protein R3P38DRAFT_3254338 [Favolaschia claudopus]|uniref:Uncharacterized protein n=1 Tax=Favolaschia claudopus TaxID=2862362 RepID=A0AAW0DTE6_9AGAR